ncbi:MAG: DUF4835 family protein [Bacteroidetes bacterium]|nr:MAG: DUF4835 family protein [Bacteroidota bacterium]TAG89390.1 MAG: DUF4835 family protein [Bacteroidota bacterium]
MKYFFVLFLWIVVSMPIFAQELNCAVTVDATRLNTAQVSEKAIFVNLEKNIRQFMIDREWTTDQFKRGVEQITCKILITVTEAPSQNSFKATAQLVSSRPVYGTNYESPLLNFNDRSFNFDYVTDQPLIFNDNNFTTNLTSVLAFYAYSVLALDYDSFSRGGGNPYIEKMFNVVNVAQASGDEGWSKTQNQVNRYWLAENLQNQIMTPFREGLYDYHRKGMDLLLTKPDEARNNIVKSLEALKEVNRLKPSSTLLNVYFDAKNREIVDIFRESSAELKQKVRLIVVNLDPANAIKYDVLAN